MSDGGSLKPRTTGLTTGGWLIGFTKGGRMVSRMKLKIP